MRLFALLSIIVYAQDDSYDYGTDAVFLSTEAAVDYTADFTATDAPAAAAPAATEEEVTLEDILAAGAASDEADAADQEEDAPDVNVLEEILKGLSNVPADDAADAADDADFDLSEMGRSRYNQPTYDDYNSGYGGKSGGATVNSIVALQLSLKANGDFEFTWNYDATHTDYNFEYQVLEGNYANVTDFLQYTAGTVDMVTDGTTTTTTLTPPADDTLYRWRITPFVSTDSGSAGTIDGQSTTNDVIHQPGVAYEGGGGYAAQVLLPTFFSNNNFVKTSTTDSAGYAIAVLVQFPAGCPDIRVDADVDGNYIFTDATLANNHRLFVFPETHFSNQFSGAIKAFHYYVSNAAYTGCDLTDPANTVTVSVANTYISRTTEAARIDIMSAWPGDSSYPPAIYNEQHAVNLTDHIQPATHIGPSRAISAPRIYFTSGACAITLNVEEGYSPGWGFVNTFNSALDMTDLWDGSSNTGTDFKLQSLIWLTQVGITFRYDTNVKDCETITSSGTITFLEMDMTNLSKAVNPTY